MDMTLREIGNTYGVSRRAVQGYEKAGLVAASGKNERGYLLYNEPLQDRIRQIRLFQQMGFNIKEIKNLIDAPGDVLKAVLERQTEKLMKQKENTEILIAKIYELIEKL
ncbi:MerR family transcriptional regulator [bacterium 1XD8-76]|nr:MerR family transcriptional regulator [bacterium 1XD8-76]